MALARSPPRQDELAAVDVGLFPVEELIADFQSCFPRQSLRERTKSQRRTDRSKEITLTRLLRISLRTPWSKNSPLLRRLPHGSFPIHGKVDASDITLRRSVQAALQERSSPCSRIRRHRNFIVYIKDDSSRGRYTVQVACATSHSCKVASTTTENNQAVWSSIHVAGCNKTWFSIVQGFDCSERRVLSTILTSPGGGFTLRVRLTGRSVSQKLRVQRQCVDLTVWSSVSCCTRNQTILPV